MKMSVRCLSSLFVLLMVVSIGAVSGATGLKCYLGDEVSFKPNPTLSSGSTITWKFWSAVGSVIRVIEFDHGESTHPHNPLFKESIAADKYTGELTLKHVKKDHSGLYYFEINGKEHQQKFTLQVMGLPPKLKMVKERDSVSLHIDVTEEQRNEKIHWKIKHNNSLVAEIITENRKISTPFIEERFRDRLKLDDQTGDLIITHMKNEDSGQYEADVTIGSITHTIHETFSFTDSGEEISSI
ncbi:uncharacterized protein LOC130430409 [Triplophysa dalaica]|uniref:uncharacterized protein LOC130429378 n=1 Tax=Triplophysa dalaica TaxID=1582913 RepID=UPI0024DF78EA|nr:uncharacterized protein LOC130429378 [Triplophysa dalaica]XP_056615493.1 uncharacterized protein LOC130430409 [Triplophysa dalaica]